MKKCDSCGYISDKVKDYKGANACPICIDVMNKPVNYYYKRDDAEYTTLQTVCFLFNVLFEKIGEVEYIIKREEKSCKE